MIKKTYGLILLSIKKLFGADLAKRFDTFLRFKRKLFLKNPKTLADKLSYIENHCQSHKASLCTDKWEVREYIKAKGLEEILVPTYGGVYDDFEQIPFDTFPEEFVLKATHGCKMNFICNSDTKFDIDSCRRTVNKWLKKSYGSYSCEWHYLDIPHRVYCEKYLSLPKNLVDYKIHCINGIPEFILTCSNRKVGIDGKMTVELGLYDVNWNKLEGLCSYKAEIPAKEALPCPNNLKKMLEIAKILSQEFKFVRIDLYEIDDKISFGEMTFTPAACVFPYFTEEFLLEYGEKLVI